jgi:hypothetical protein
VAAVSASCLAAVDSPRFFSSQKKDDDADGPWTTLALNNPQTSVACCVNRFPMRRCVAESGVGYALGKHDQWLQEQSRSS